MAYKNLSMEIFIKVNIRRESFMVKGNIVGPTDLHMKVISLREVDKARVIGNLREKAAIYIQGDIKAIKNQDMEDISGLMGAFTKVISKMISSN